MYVHIHLHETTAKPPTKYDNAERRASARVYICTEEYMCTHVHVYPSSHVMTWHDIAWHAYIYIYIRYRYMFVIVHTRKLTSMLMHGCTYVRKSAYVHTYTSIHTHLWCLQRKVYVYARESTHTQHHIYAYARVYICTEEYICTQLHVYPRTCTCVCTCMCVCTHTHMCVSAEPWASRIRQSWFSALV